MHFSNFQKQSYVYKTLLFSDKVFFHKSNQKYKKFQHVGIKECIYIKFKLFCNYKN